MGLSSSQARLLNLTTRMHQIEYKAAKLEAEKLQMANESTKAYEDYLEALETTKVQYKILTTDGSVSYHDINNYQDFISAGYAVQFNNHVYNGTTAFAVKGAPEYVKTTPVINVTEADIIGNVYAWGPTEPGDYYASISTADKFYHKDQVDIAEQKTLNFAQLCHDAFGADVNTPPANVSEVITNLINSGDVTLVEKKKGEGFLQPSAIDFENYETSVAIDTGLREVQDESLLRKAEAKYEANMKKIDMKDRKFDQDLAALEAERNAIKQEMETLKTVAKENVERTFKLFS